MDGNISTELSWNSLSSSVFEIGWEELFWPNNKVTSGVQCIN